MAFAKHVTDTNNIRKECIKH